MRVLGLMSGTSHDGIDAAVVDFAPGESGELVGEIIGSCVGHYSPELRERLIAALPPAPSTLAEVCALDTLIGQAFASTAQEAIGQFGPVDLIASHGQTVFHWVEAGEVRGSLQIGQPAWIAEATGVPVVSDFRARDIAAGGQGAPLVPYLDELLLAGGDRPRAALNLGGIANVTLVRPGSPTIAFDTGPANALVDAVVQQLGLDPAGYDSDGNLAAKGRVDQLLLAQLLNDPYYRQAPPKSTGKEYFNLDYVAQRVDLEAVDSADLVATLTRLTAVTVAQALADVDEVMVGGGGWRNPTLMAWIDELTGSTRIVDSSACGVDPDIKEAVAFALLGWATWNGVEANVPSCTGAAGNRVLGTVTPGSEALAFPVRSIPPRSLRLVPKVSADSRGS